MADEEDVALSVLDSFCRAAQDGRFPDLADREGLWRLLLHKTVHKAIDLARHEKRLRRGVFRSVRALEKAITDYVQHHNDNPKGFIWTKKAQNILEKVTRAKAALDKIPSA